MSGRNEKEVDKRHDGEEAGLPAYGANEVYL